MRLSTWGDSDAQHFKPGRDTEDATLNNLRNIPKPENASTSALSRERWRERAFLRFRTIFALGTTNLAATCSLKADLQKKRKPFGAMRSAVSSE